MGSLTDLSKSFARKLNILQVVVRVSRSEGVRCDMIESHSSLGRRVVGKEVISESYKIRDT